jgi:hypothetical protein
MAIEDKISKEFLQGISLSESKLSEMGFNMSSIVEKGLAFYIEFKRNDCKVEFLFGPGDFEIEMIIYTSKGKFAFRDLLQISPILEWVNNNRYTPKNHRILNDELSWFIELLKVSIPIIL